MKDSVKYAVGAAALAACIGMPGFGMQGNLAYAEKMPVYRLQKASVDRGKASEMFEAAMDKKAQAQENAQSLKFTAGSQVLEVDKRSGHVFMADMEELWNPRKRPELPSQAQARQIAEEFINARGLAKDSGDAVSVEFSDQTMTRAVGDGPEDNEEIVLDRQVNYSGFVNLRGGRGKSQKLPIVGGGAKYQVSIGDKGRVVGFRGGLREVTGQVGQVDVKTRDQAIAEFRKNGGANAVDVRAELAYYAAPGFEEQEFMPPVWVVHSSSRYGDELVPNRSQIIAGNDQYRPNFGRGQPSRARDKNEKPPRIEPNPDEESGGKQGFLDWLIPSAHAAAGPDCGTWWIGDSQGLPGSSGNRQGFVDGCRAAGWNVRYNFGESSAWESDWRRNDDNYVDNVDLVFYTGHASPNGWVLNSPDDTFLHFNDVGGSPDMWGSNDLEWLIIAACGPLQSTHFTSNTTNAFSRWRNAFNGLHVMMGYGAVTYDNTSEGRRFMELTRAGWNVIDAWFRTAWEIQPSTNGWAPPNGSRIYAVAMYAHNGDHCARNDHLWGMGSTCADVPAGSSQRRYMLWSGT